MVRFARTAAQGLLLFICLAGGTTTAQSEELLFPVELWGQARLALPQSYGALESLMEVRDDNFEPIEGFSEHNPYRKLALAVGRLELKVQTPTGARGIMTCTAWLISRDYALTNHHCIPGREGHRLLEARVRMGYLSDFDKEGKYFPVDIEPVEANRSLDYSVLTVRGNPAAKYGTIQLNPKDPVKGEELFIIHHPMGQPQRLTRKGCRATSQNSIAGNDIHHRCDTLLGSSGAPVFSDITRKVVGIHYQGAVGEGSYNSAKRLQQIVIRSVVLGKIMRDQSLQQTKLLQTPPLATCGTYGSLAVNTCLYDKCEDRLVKNVCGAATSGKADSQYVFGNIHFEGLGVKQNYEKAAQWYRRSAEQGFMFAQTNLGYLYEKGYGIAPDLETFVYWTSKAAEQGDQWAQANLGEAYDLGKGVPQSYQTAAYWYKKAADQGNEIAKERMKFLYGNPNQLFDLGFKYFDGKGVERNYDLAEYWFRKAAMKGLAGAQSQLGFMYDQGYGLRRDDAEAARWFREAAEQGLAVGQYNLGTRYEVGKGVRKDRKTAIYWYKKAAKQGYENARKALKSLN